MLDSTEKHNTRLFWVFVMLLLCILGTGPLLTLYSLNTLFGLQLAYNFSTWLAASIFAGLLAGRGVIKKLLILIGLGAVVTKIVDSFKKD